MKQNFSNSSYFGDHGATVVFSVCAFLYCRESVQKFLVLKYYKYISPIVHNAFYCKARLALIFADPVTYVAVKSY